MIEQLMQLVTMRQAELQVSLAKGTPITWDAYQRMVGEHQGLQYALDMIDNMLEEEKNLD